MFKKMKEEVGFTLAELLIVVAIIGVLVAISIPVFNGQIEKARDATTVANLRAAYAEAQTAYMTETSSEDGRVEYSSYNPDDNDSEAIVKVKGFVAKGKKKNNFSGLADNLPFKKSFNWTMKSLDDGYGKKFIVEFKYEKDGTLHTVQVFNQN